MNKKLIKEKKLVKKGNRYVNADELTDANLQIIKKVIDNEVKRRKKLEKE